MVSKASDLTLGEYARLLENPVRWQRLQLQLDRAEFLKPLQRIREIRNDVMHFDPDPLAEDDLKLLKTSWRFFRTSDKFFTAEVLSTEARQDVDHSCGLATRKTALKHRREVLRERVVPHPVRADLGAGR